MVFFENKKKWGSYRNHLTYHYPGQRKLICPQAELPRNVCANLQSQTCLHLHVVGL